MSVEEVTHDYLYENIPFIVTDASQDWRALKEFDLDFLKKVGQSDLSCTL